MVSLLVRLWVEMTKTRFSSCRNPVSLLVRLWVEITLGMNTIGWRNVSLLVRLWVEILHQIKQSKGEKVSLLVRLWVEITSLKYLDYGKICQPPCEAVSWNTQGSDLFIQVVMSASLWGCELKYFSFTHEVMSNESASLWGCELKYESASEMWANIMSASLWGCELKLESVGTRKQWMMGQPPCEAVSWNTSLATVDGTFSVSLLVRLWVEMISPVCPLS